MANTSKRFVVAMPKPYSKLTPEERHAVALQVAHAAKQVAQNKVSDGGDAAK